MNQFIKTMDNLYTWNSEHADVFLAIMSVTIGFISYWFLSLNPKIKVWFLKKYLNDRAYIIYVSFQRLIGVVFMGVIPGILLLSFTDYSLAELGLRTGNLKSSLFYIAVVSPILLGIGYLMSKNSNHRDIYPHMRLKLWSKKTQIINAIGWGAYLLVYEFMFRGILLMVCFNTFGFWPALAINLMFYSATHIAKGFGETLGAFTYGIVLCLVTLSTGSILFAFIAHLVLALGVDSFSLANKSEINVE